MFLKLLKHELRASGRALLPLFGGLILMALLARGSIWLLSTSQNSVTGVLSGSLIFLFILGCFGVVIVTAVLMMVRFARSVHGDEGYLTNTLPVSEHAILLSRVLISFFAIAAACGVVYLGYRICTYRVKSFSDLVNALQELFLQAEVDVRATLWKALASGALSLLTLILQIFAAISIGHSFNTGKTGKSILFYFVLNAGVRILSSFVMLLVSNLKYGESGGNILTVMDTVPNFMFYYNLAQSLILCFVFYFVSWIMMKKRLNLA